MVGVVRSDPAQWQHGRVEITPTTAIVRSPGIHEASSENHLDLVWFALDPPDSEDEFEERLRSYIAQQSGGIHIIGMSRGGSDEEYWLLDSNYLSLELVGGRARQFPRYADHPSAKVRGRLAFVWDRFDTRAYGERVISRLTVDGELRFYVKNREQAAFLAGIGGRPRVEASGPLTDEDLRLLPLGPLIEFRLHENPYPVDLSFLAGARDLTELQLINCEGELDLRPLTGLRLEALTLTGLPHVGELSAVSRMTSLRKLALGRPASAGPITLPPRIIELSVTEHWDVAGLEHCTALATLAIGLGRSATDLWHRLSGLPALAHLLVFDVSVSDLALAQPLHRLWALTLVDVSDPEQLWRLRMICPNLRLLSIVADPDSFDHARLAASLPDCNLIISGPDSD